MHVRTVHHKCTHCIIKMHIQNWNRLLKFKWSLYFIPTTGKKEIRVARAAENAITFWKCSACRDGKLCMIVVVVRRKGSRASTRLQYKGGIHKSSIAESERGIYYKHTRTPTFPGFPKWRLTTLTNMITHFFYKFIAKIADF